MGAVFARLKWEVQGWRACTVPRPCTEQLAGLPELASARQRAQPVKSGRTGREW